MEDKRIYLMKEAPVSKAVNAMAAPAIAGLMVMAVYNIVDTMFVAWLGTEATGATQVVMPIMMLLSAIGLAFGMGGGGYVSRLLGAGDRERAHKVATVSLFISLGTGLIVMIFLLLFLEPVLSFFGASGSVLAEARTYGFFIVLGTLFSVSNMTMNNLMRSDGSAKLSMVAMAAGALLNIILDPLFIFGLDLGIAGAAIATSFSQGVTFAILLSHYIGKRTVVHIHYSYFQPTLKMIAEIMKIGIPTFIRQVLFSISLGILNQSAFSAGGGDLLAAVGLVFRITMMPMYIIFGLGQGFQPVAGYNYGAGNHRRVTGSLVYTLLFGGAVSLTAALILIFAGGQLLSIFKPTAEVLELGKKGLLYMSFALLILSLNNSISVFFQAIGKGKPSIILALSRQGLFFIPLCFILPSLMGATGVLLVQPFADLITLLLSCFLLVRYLMGKGGRSLEKEESLIGSHT